MKPGNCTNMKILTGNIACVGNICTYSFTISVIPSAGPGVDSMFSLSSQPSHFPISSPGYPSPTNTTPVPCLYNDTNTTPPVSTTPQNHSYSALYCSTSTTTSSTGTTTTTNSPWQINWGYNANGDFAVMTVVDTSKGQDAFLYVCFSLHLLFVAFLHFSRLHFIKANTSSRPFWMEKGLKFQSDALTSFFLFHIFHQNLTLASPFPPPLPRIPQTPSPKNSNSNFEEAS